MRFVLRLLLDYDCERVELGRRKKESPCNALMAIGRWVNIDSPVLL